MAVTPQSLREQRKQIGEQMRAMVQAAAEEGRDFSAEENQKWERMEADEVRLQRQADQLEKLEQQHRASQEMEQLQARREFVANPRTADESKPTREDRSRALGAWLRGSNYSERDREAAAKCGIDLGSKELRVRTSLFSRAPRSLSELRSMQQELVTRATTTAQTITTTAGGYLVDSELASSVEMALLAYGGMREAARVIRTQTGGTLNIPTVDDTTNKSSVLGINTAADVEALRFGQVQLSAYKYTTDQILVPMELDQDADPALGLQSMIGEALGIRAARGTNYHFTVGVTSDTQPSGVVTDSIVGTTGSDVATVTYNELVSLMHSVDPAYRMSSSCRWMFNDTTLSYLKKIVDGDSRPLWMPGLSGISGDFPDTLLGKPYTINQDMSSIASATTGPGAVKAIIFGAFDRYVIRDVRDMVMLRLTERYAEKAQVAFLGFHRHDGKTVIATTATPPIKHFITKST